VSAEIENLVERAKQGDHNAFDALFAQYQSRLHPFCAKYLLQPEDQEDAVAETFRRAYHALAAFEARASFATWLYRIAHNVCLDILKERGKLPQASLYGAQGEVVMDPPDPAPTPEQLAVWQQMRASILRCARTVRPPWEEPTDYLIYYFHCEREESFRAVAERLHMNESAVKQRYLRKIQPLLQRIEQEFR
jgi:RNA polymerase sigma-70 factor (ECF subfamily)